MIVTTAGRTNEAMIQLAKKVANDIAMPFVQRNKKSIQALQIEHESDILVIGKNRFEWFRYGEAEPIFFHPNTAAFRAKRWLAGEVEPFLSATRLKYGMSFLDCTLGLASDSIMASLVVGGKGKVVGIEGNMLLAYLVETGLKNWEMSIKETKKAMNRIQVVQGNHSEILMSLADNSFDVVYFDPMFDNKIEESSGIRFIRKIALYDDITEYTITQALRVARKRVVLKDHYLSKRFEHFGFHVHKRKTAKFHFGYLEINEESWTSYK